MYRCDICNKSFTSKGGLDLHLNTQTHIDKLNEGREDSKKQPSKRDSGEYRCNLCNKSFASKVALHRHFDS